MLGGGESPPSTADVKSEHVGLVIEQKALPVRQRSPSWPPMKIDLHEELKKVQRPKRGQKAVLVSFLVFLNDVVIFLAATVLLINYLDVDTSTAFGPGFIVAGKLQADAMDISIDGEQNAVFRSESGHSAVSVEAANSMSAKIVLSKDTSTWNIANDPADQLVISKGRTAFLELTAEASGGPTTTVSTHINTRDNTVFGSPLIMSTAGPIAKMTTPMANCETSPANCVIADDIVLSPGLAGRVRINAAIAPVSGDLVIEPEERLRVQKVSGSMASVMLENARLQLVNAEGTACLQAAAAAHPTSAVLRLAAEGRCGGINTIKTLDEQVGDVGKQGELSISDAIFVDPLTKKITFAGNFGIGDFPVEGTPLQLYARAPTTGSSCLAVQSTTCEPLAQVACAANTANCVYSSGTNCTAIEAPACLALNETACGLDADCLYNTPISQITLEALGGGKVVINSPAHMIGPLVPQQVVGGVGRLTVTGTMRVQNLQFQLMETESARMDSAPTPSLTCNFAQPDRFGWLRLTRSAASRKYHLYLCTENGWKDLIAPDPAVVGRRRRRLDVVAGLDRLVELFGAGMLDQDEFAASKAQLLAAASANQAAEQTTDQPVLADAVSAAALAAIAQGLPQLPVVPPADGGGL